MDRITALLEVMLPTNVLADIGCDHGKAGVSAIKRRLAKHVIFADVSAPSLEKARRLCGQEGIGNAEFVHSDGCDKIKYADTLLIAGMGGKEITAILSKCKFVPKQLVLQPMRNQKELREYLKENWYAEIDKTVFDKKFYTVLRCSSGRENPDELGLIFGKTDLKEKTDDFKKFLETETIKTGALLKTGFDGKWKNYMELLSQARGQVNYD